MATLALLYAQGGHKGMVECLQEKKSEGPEKVGSGEKCHHSYKQMWMRNRWFDFRKQDCIKKSLALQSRQGSRIMYSMGGRLELWKKS